MEIFLLFFFVAWILLMIFALVATLIFAGLMLHAWGLGTALSALGISGNKTPSVKVAGAVLGLILSLGGFLSYQTTVRPLWMLPLLFTVAFLLPLATYHHPHVGKGALLGVVGMTLALFLGRLLGTGGSPETFQPTYFGGLVGTTQQTTGELLLGATQLSLSAWPGVLIAILRRRN
jgi:hypothetical protein